jgi:predicted PurR-regulated permease PerM
MNPETEELFKKWLKIQIFKHNLALVLTVLLFVVFLTSSIISYLYIVPAIKEQIRNTQTILDKLSTSPEGQEKINKSLEGEPSNPLMHILTP